MRLKLWFTAAVDLFRFVSRYRARVAQAQFDERQHQLAIVRELVSGFVDLARANQEGLLEIAKAQVAQAESFQLWLKGFQSAGVTPEPSSSVTDEMEWLEEQKRLAANGDIEAIATLPPEFQFALALEHMNAEQLGNFDREGQDFPSS
jgi:hypothetical protein